jgi:hypothetical protein
VSKIPILRRLLIFEIAFVLAGSLSVQGQDKKRVITWPPYSTSTVQAVGPGAKVSPITDAVEVVSIEVAGQSIKVGQRFSADDDWLGSLTVRLKNISGQPISGAQISFILPETAAPDRGMLTTKLLYGTSYLSKQSDVPHKSVAPDEVFELKFTAAEYEQEKRRILQAGLSTGVLKLWIGSTMLRFEDGTNWGGGCLKSSDPGNACR